MVQGLQHQRQIEARIWKWDGLCTSGDKLQARLRRCQVLRVLPNVNLQASHTARRMPCQQRSRQARTAASQLDDVLPRQRHHGGQHIQFVVDQWDFLHSEFSLGFSV